MGKTESQYDAKGSLSRAESRVVASGQFHKWSQFGCSRDSIPIFYCLSFIARNKWPLYHSKQGEFECLVHQGESMVLKSKYTSGKIVGVSYGISHY